jgi:hypothetical protein
MIFKRLWEPEKVLFFQYHKLCFFVTILTWVKSVKKKVFFGMVSSLNADSFYIITIGVFIFFWLGSHGLFKNPNQS